MDLRKKSAPSKPLPQVPCKVCARLIPEPMLFCSSECQRIDKIAEERAKHRPDPKLLECVEEEAKALGLKRGLHVHLTYFGSELACPICNPNCYKNHGISKEFFCGDENCPMNPKRCG